MAEYSKRNTGYVFQETIHVDVEYERIRKKCFHCFRLSHEKQRCPILKGVKNKGLARMDKGKGVEITHVVHRKNHTDLVDTLMPLMSQSVPPGFVPRSVVAPEVFEEMHLYMNCTNPEERRIREFRMKEVLRVLSSNPGAQSSYLRLEKHPRISGVQNKELGRVFDFRTAETETERLLTEGVMMLNTTNEGGRVDITDCSRNISDVLEANTTDHRVLMVPNKNALIDQQRQIMEGAGDYQPPKSGVAFCMGHDRSVSGASGQTDHISEQQNEVDSSVKRKSREEMEVASKLSKQSEVSLSGGLALFWRNSHEVEILSASDRIIDIRVKQRDLIYFISFVNGNPVRHKRHIVWDNLKTIGLNRNAGWCLVGDFNEMMNTAEKSGGPVREESSFYPFRSMARDCRIKEVPSSGEKMSSAGVREIMNDGVNEKSDTNWMRNESSNSRKMIEKHRVELEEEEKKINPSMSRMVFLKLELANMGREMDHGYGASSACQQTTIVKCQPQAYSKHGAYTVKTGYELMARTMVLEAGQITPQEQARIDLKKKVWKIPTLPKIRLFLWRALSGALAVAERLNSRGLGVEPNCKICDGGSETVNHVLFRCSSALQIWSAANIVLPTNVLQQSLEENVSFVFSAMEDSRNPQGVYRAIPWVMWMIWKKRNSLLYANTQDSIERLLQIMTEEVEQFLKYDAATSGSYGNYDGGGTQMVSA
ncbi:hypothetical protein Bca4012_037873 [Brassica carinata]